MGSRDGWMDGLGVGRSGGRMKLKVGHATQLPPLRRGEAISDIFDFHHPRSLLWRDERGEKGLAISLSSICVPFVPRLSLSEEASEPFLPPDEKREA